MDRTLTEQGRTGGRFLWTFFSVLAGLAMGAGLMWWGAYGYHDRVRTATIQSLNEQLLQARSQLDQLHAERGVLEGRLAVESSTRQGLERTLAALQQELGAAREQIAFFHELMPSGPEGSISIRGLDFRQHGDLLNFRVVLMRHGAGDQLFDGMLQFNAQGKRDGEAVTVQLEPARLRDADSRPAEPGADNDAQEAGSDDDVASVSILSLKFDQFQRRAGLLQIPENLELESVTLNVLEGDTLRVSRTMEIPEPGPVQ